MSRKFFQHLWPLTLSNPLVLCDTCSENFGRVASRTNNGSYTVGISNIFALTTFLHINEERPNSSFKICSCTSVVSKVFVLHRSNGEISVFSFLQLNPIFLPGYNWWWISNFDGATNCLIVTNARSVRPLGARLFTRNLNRNYNEKL